MSWDKNKLIPLKEIEEMVTEETVRFAKEFGAYLVTGVKNSVEPLTTSQLRKFFGEVKRQQMTGYNETDFIMLKPKLAYAVGRTKKDRRKEYKIADFYLVLADAIDKVGQCQDKEKAFKNFITIFEAIVAYHKEKESEKETENYL